ncbi:transposase [Streptomyces sp. NPDC056653]|uniref:transposase n=1 Tax=Streptomyces sp. NPDC056653 TaxID=3345894 RepID=UPI003677CD8E
MTHTYGRRARNPLELRERAVRMYRTTEPKPVIKRLAAELGVHPEALRGWIRQAEADHGGARGCQVECVRWGMTSYWSGSGRGYCR